MQCRTCDGLLAGFEVAVWQYATAVRSIRTVEGTARQAAFEEADRLRRECLDADNALRAHRLENHAQMGWIVVYRRAKIGL